MAQTPATTASSNPLFVRPEPPPLYDHQEFSANFIVATERVMDASDAGSGKTRSTIAAFARIKSTSPSLSGLILAPKSILEPAWGNDLRKFAPHLTYSVAYANNRARAFRTPADLYITNHDAAAWLSKNLDLLESLNIDFVAVDESTAFKRHTSGRSKALASLLKHLDPRYRVMLSGTPNINDPLHIWNQIRLLDDGERLGTNYYRFRNQVCQPENTSRFAKWAPKPEANEAIAELIEDITLRHRLEDCTDIPPNHSIDYPYELPKPLHTAYDAMRTQALIELGDTTVSAINAAVLHNKLLQIASGSVFDQHHNAMPLDMERYELVAELIKARQQCVVAFHWKHQRDQLLAAFDQAGLSHTVVDGEVNDAARQRAVRAFNAGDKQIFLAHPASAGHGLTLTAGTTTIWPSPTSNAELYLQFNRRIYRNGQTKKTETLSIIANDTIEAATHARCTDRVLQQMSTLKLLQSYL